VCEDTNAFIALDAGRHLDRSIPGKGDFESHWLEESGSTHVARDGQATIGSPLLTLVRDFCKSPTNVREWVKSWYFANPNAASVQKMTNLYGSRKHHTPPTPFKLESSMGRRSEYTIQWKVSGIMFGSRLESISYKDTGHTESAAHTGLYQRLSQLSQCQ